MLASPGAAGWRPVPFGAETQAMNYDMTVGEGLILYDGPAVVNEHDVENVQLWFPLVSKDLRLRWTATDSVEHRDKAEITFEYPHLGVCHAEGFVLDNSVVFGTGSGTASGTIDSTVIGDPTALVEHVTSGWVNLPILGATRNRFDDYSTVIEAAGWKAGFSAIQPFSERQRHVRRVGIPVHISHRSGLARVDGAQFTANHALNALHAFQLALSFTLGRFVGPIAPGGYSDGQLRWVLTPAWFCDEGVGAEGIIFPLVSEDFADAVARLATALLSPDADAASIRYLTMHAIVAHTAGLAEQRLMTAQAGLEFYAWHRLVGGQQLSASQARKLSAEERIQRAVNAAQIPDDIPDELEALIDQATDPDESDVPTVGPGVGAWVRNRISHPKDPNKPYAIEGLVFQASLLMREYLELLILHHLGYQGSWRRMYPPGRWAGDSEPVPWSTGLAGP